MACIHIKHYPKVKDLIHPNITENIDFHKKEVHYILPVYHGWGLRNRNGFNKRIDYERGEQCLLATINLIGEEQKTNINSKKIIMQDTSQNTIFAIYL